MLEEHAERSAGIEIAVGRLIGLANEGSEGNERARDMEEALYGLTGYLLDLFRLEDQYRYETVSEEDSGLTDLRQQLAQNLTRVFEGVIAKDAGFTADSDLIVELQFIANLFQRYRAKSAKSPSNAISSA